MGCLVVGSFSWLFSRRVVRLSGRRVVGSLFFMVVWSSGRCFYGHLVVRSSVLWLSGHQVVGSLVLWLCLVIKSSGDLVIWSSGLVVKWSGRLVIRFSSHLVTWSSNRIIRSSCRSEPREGSGIAPNRAGRERGKVAQVYIYIIHRRGSANRAPLLKDERPHALDLVS